MDESASQPAHRLNYRIPERRRELPPARQVQSFKIAIWCWALPLGSGLLDFLLWVLIRFWPLADYSIFIILLGVLCSAFGGIATLVFLITRWSASIRPVRQAILPAILLLALLCSNFVVAVVLVGAAQAIDPDVLGHHGPPYDTKVSVQHAHP